jgi:hypothetical protein
MKKNFTNILSKFILLFILISSRSIAQVSSLTENFDVVVPDQWVAINHSTGTGGQSWIQGDTRFLVSYSGDSNSYAAASYKSVGPRTSIGTINNWLITPVLNLNNGASFSFYTRTVSGSTYPDRLEVRLSANGASTDVGTGVNSTGDFSTLLLSINPDLHAGGYPDTGWTKYDVTISGIGNITGRIAFRYYVTNAGSGGTNSNYIGIDEFSYETALPVSLLNFTGTVKNKQAILNWATADEINNKGFEVQLSHDNRNFSSVGFVPAQQNKSGVNKYSFTDNNLLSGSNYYRLKQVDNDGNYKYSVVVKLDLKKFDWTILGNPSSNTLVQIQTEKTCSVALQIVSMTGKTIQIINKGNLPAGTTTVPLNLQNAAHGVYIIKLLVDNESYSKQLLR